MVEVDASDENLLSPIFKPLRLRMKINENKSVFYCINRYLHIG